MFCNVISISNVIATSKEVAKTTSSVRVQSNGVPHQNWFPRTVTKVSKPKVQKKDLWVVPVKTNDMLCSFHFHIFCVFCVLYIVTVFESCNPDSMWSWRQDGSKKKSTAIPKTAVKSAAIPKTAVQFLEQESSIAAASFPLGRHFIILTPGLITMNRINLKLNLLWRRRIFLAVIWDLEACNPGAQPWFRPSETSQGAVEINPLMERFAMMDEMLIEWCLMTLNDGWRIMIFKVPWSGNMLLDLTAFEVPGGSWERWHQLTFASVGHFDGHVACMGVSGGTRIWEKKLAFSLEKKRNTFFRVDHFVKDGPDIHDAQYVGKGWHVIAADVFVFPVQEASIDKVKSNLNFLLEELMPSKDFWVPWMGIRLITRCGNRIRVAVTLLSSMNIHIIH